jgi:hypothetical protein
MKLIGWGLVLVGALASSWALVIFAGKAPGPAWTAPPAAVLGAVVFIAGWACMRLSRRR